MYCTSTIRSSYVLEHLRLTLPFQCGVTTTHDRVAQIVEAMIIVAQLALIECEVAVTNLHSQLVNKE